MGLSLSVPWGGLRVIDAGRLPAEEVSRHFRAMDMHLAPFMDGVSTRRGSFMTGIQHGIATATTVGSQTDQILKEEVGNGMLASAEEDKKLYASQVLHLYQNRQAAHTLGRAGRDFYLVTCDWAAVAQKLVGHLLHSSNKGLNPDT